MKEFRKRADYIGHPRLNRALDGKMVPTNNRIFDPGSVYGTRRVVVNLNHPRGRARWVDHKEFKKVPFLIWTVADAAKAVDRGYFVERSAIDNHARIIVLHSFTTDANVIEVETGRAKGGDEHAHKLLWFVFQQDQYGWNGTWENETIATYRPSLIWYKHFKGATPHARVAADKLRDNPGRPLGRPRGTPEQRMEIEELQARAWRESEAFANDVPFAAWLESQPTGPSVQGELNRLRDHFGIDPPPPPERKPRGRPRKLIDGKGPIYRAREAWIKAREDAK